jgi:hypothetical protein
VKQFKQPDSGGDLVSVLKAVLMSRRDIANYLALTIETVARVMSHLRELGMICFPQKRRWFSTRRGCASWSSSTSGVALKNSINVFRRFAAESCPVCVRRLRRFEN